MQFNFQIAGGLNHLDNGTMSSRFTSGQCSHWTSGSQASRRRGCQLRRSRQFRNWHLLVKLRPSFSVDYCVSNLHYQTPHPILPCPCPSSAGSGQARYGPDHTRTPRMPCDCHAMPCHTMLIPLLFCVGSYISAV